MIEVMGLTRLDDQMLITELINYKPKASVDKLDNAGNSNTT